MQNRKMEPKDSDDFVKRMFDEVSRQFEQMDQMMEGLFRSGRSSAPGVTTFGPYVYGYSMTMGPDGKPQISEFGNFRPSDVSQAPALGTREPLVDTVLDSKKNTVRIAAEMPGVTKEDVKVSATEKLVTISTSKGDRKYHSEVPMPAEIIPGSIVANYNNGILELTARVRSASKKKGVDVKVE